MTANSEARKRRWEVSQAKNEQAARDTERRREMTRDALAGIMSGASFLDADAFLDQLDDLGGFVGMRQ